MTTLSDLPVIIEAPGDYLTRDGRRVTIHEIKGPSTFSAKGHLWRMFRGKYVPKNYDIWHVSGRYKAVGESPEDIIKAVGEPEAGRLSYSFMKTPPATPPATPSIRPTR